MKTVNVHDAKTQFSALIRDVRSGREREIVIALAGEPVAKLVPVDTPKPRELGIDRGLIKVAPDFDDADMQIQELFEGE